MRQELCSAEFKNDLLHLAENNSEADEEITLQESLGEATATEDVCE
jgi:hypothetical protein